VIGPADDGGYYLMGLRAAQPAPFEASPGGSADVLAQTLAIAQRAGLSVELVSSWHDVDTIDDLSRAASSSCGST
jgi:glycosyltransferase A (GT-A) superfamily protein (DUF2064 family)